MGLCHPVSPQKVAIVNSNIIMYNIIGVRIFHGMAPNQMAARGLSMCANGKYWVMV